MIRVLILGIVGPVLALVVVWQPVKSVASIEAGKAPSTSTVERLRTTPDDSVLVELRQIAVSYPRFYGTPRADVLEMAAQLLAHEYMAEALEDPIGVPFEAGRYLLGHSAWHLELHSFSIPSVLGSAYEQSGETRYLSAAVEYILDWAEYELSLLVPRGYFFNDHALAARSIVVTEVWRLYRGSEVYSPEQGTALLHYVKQLSRLLQQDDLYEYRTNHGIMQSLSLLHLAIAFPQLEDAGENRRVGVQRLFSQLGYYLNEEGVILEHSSGYHQNGTKRIAAALRYMEMLGEVIPDDLLSRFAKAVEFLRALRRPDRTLPLIGDTEARPYAPVEFPLLNGRSQAVAIVEPLELARPPPVTIAPGAGWVVLWDGLSQWPDSSRLTQTVLQWANFPTHAHKHADDMAVSLWSRGQQWTSGVGYWRYNDGRTSAIGWRSSNGPHWLGESSASDRTSRLEGSVLDDQLTFFDVLRTNADGSRIRRQLVKLDDDFWMVFDSFDSPVRHGAEVIWRFSHDITMDSSQEGHLLLSSSDRKENMRLRIDGMDEFKIDVDAAGRAAWNSGMNIDGKVATSPAVRVTSRADNPVIMTSLMDTDATSNEGGRNRAEWHWDKESAWSFAVRLAPGRTAKVERREGGIQVQRAGSPPRQLAISTGIADRGDEPRQAALDAFHRASAHYGIPFHPMLDRRIKVTLAIAAAAVAQMALVVLLRTKVGKPWLQPLAIASLLAWSGLAAYLGLVFLN